VRSAVHRTGRGRGRHRWATLAAVVGLLQITGCTSVIDGQASPVPEEQSSPAPTSADPTPAPELSAGTQVEALRIAGATVQPQFVYPELDDSCFPTTPVVRPEGLGQLFIEGTAESTYTRYGFVAGWMSCRGETEGPRSAVVFVAEMSDEDSAAVAAEELATNFEEATGSSRIEIPGFENLPALSNPEVVDGEDRITLEVLQPVGRMLAYFYYTDTAVDNAEEDLAELLEEQRQLLGDFEPTPQDEIAELDPDPYDLARHTAQPPAEADVFTGSYDLPAYLHLAIDPQIEADLLPANGFIGLYNHSGYDEAGALYQFQTYEFGSLPEADEVHHEFARIEQEEFTDRVPFQVPEDATIPCFYIPATEAGGMVYQRCYSRVGPLLGLTDVYAVTDPADITAIRGFVQEQIRLMSAP